MNASLTLVRMMVHVWTKLQVTCVIVLLDTLVMIALRVSQLLTKNRYFAKFYYNRCGTEWAGGLGVVCVVACLR